MDKIKIIIVDDHVLFSESLSYLVGSFKEFEVIGNYGNGREFISALSEETLMPNVILLDINMPIMNGVETMKWIKENHPNLKVIVLSVNDDENTIMKMMADGVKGYLLKDTSPNQFREALLEVYNKGFYYSERISSCLINELRNGHNRVFLKEREVEFIKLACTEKTYNEIAVEMHLSPKTVDGYRENLFQKLEIKTRIGLVLYAMKNKIVCV
ncbi:response regulator transcription factor [Flavobacterium aestivum]|uniref:response regulator transcription factor n=1 Tax=Flavobacterium aestivum TaxID=3003257 RepID=UPI0022855882|nr:response regulator transcription factor [Flavobacterium aestivum]